MSIDCQNFKTTNNLSRIVEEQVKADAFSRKKKSGKKGTATFSINYYNDIFLIEYSFKKFLNFFFFPSVSVIKL